MVVVERGYIQCFSFNLPSEDAYKGMHIHTVLTFLGYSLSDP